MKSRVFLSTVAALCMCGMVLAAGPKEVQLENVHQFKGQLGDRTPGTITSFSTTLQQVGALTAQVDITAATSGAVSVTSYEHVLLYGQIYDYPWQAPYGTDNTFISGSSVITPLAPVGGPWSASFTFTVPQPNTYQAFGLVLLGWYPGLPWLSGSPYDTGFWWYTRASSYPGPTSYIDSTQPPTPTPDPNAGGNPIPTLNWLGMLAMVAMLFGVAVLVFIRRK